MCKDEDPRQPGWDEPEDPTQEHIFRCPKCGMTSTGKPSQLDGVGVYVDLKTKLHFSCGRCKYQWIEDTLDKRG